MINLSKDCENCVGRNTGNGCEELNDYDTCPCGICIVKAMCENWCEEYINWMNIKEN